VKQGIVTEGYSGLASLTTLPGGPVDSVVSNIAIRLNASPAQVLLKWVRAKGVVVITTSTKKFRLAEYLAVEDLPALTQEEIAAIDAAGAMGPYMTPGTVLYLMRRPLTSLWPGYHDSLGQVSPLLAVCAIALLLVFMTYFLRLGWMW